MCSLAWNKAHGSRQEVTLSIYIWNEPLTLHHMCAFNNGIVIMDSVTFSYLNSDALISLLGVLQTTPHKVIQMFKHNMTK